MPGEREQDPTQIPLEPDDLNLVKQANRAASQLKVVFAGAGRIPQEYRLDLERGIDNIVEAFKYEVRQAHIVRQATRLGIRSSERKS